ncbi:PTS sugar transporter subunit IIA [Ectothiorhodospiraceae bacterium 2226]|nr:PTS sugar transporter subunit IIA [Ectothiorhodospiraceae bacterium 2226]
MSVGILVITHSQIGQAIMDTACSMLTQCPLDVEILPIPQDSDPERQAARAHDLVHKLNRGDGVLVLTDMYGSTPSNIASRLLDPEGRVQVVAGVNLPMFIRVMNYPHLNLEELTAKALSGGHDGIMACRPSVEG